jgi:hypothetical protein
MSVRDEVVAILQSRGGSIVAEEGAEVASAADTLAGINALQQAVVRLAEAIDELAEG